MTAQFFRKFLLLPALAATFTFAGCDAVSSDAGAFEGATDGAVTDETQIETGFRFDAEGEETSENDLFVLPGDSLIFHTTEQDTSGRGDD